MSSREKITELLPRKRTEAVFRKSRVFRIIVRLPFYFVFCPVIFFSSLAAGTNFGRIAGGLVILTAVPVGLFLWALFWGWTKKICYLNWRRAVEAGRAPD
jgi:hypothetical protein